MKKLLSIILSLAIVMISFTYCRTIFMKQVPADEEENYESENTVNGFEVEETVPETEPPYDIRNFSFNDMQTKDINLVEIYGYNFPENYVEVYYSRAKIWDIVNNSIVIYTRDIIREGNSYHFSDKRVSMSGTYTFVSEDIMRVYAYGEGEGTLSINQRVSHSTKDNVVVLKGTNNGTSYWWINEDAIDWDKAPEEVLNEDGESYNPEIFKFYLK